MIRVVIDTNVIVSAAFKDRTPEEIILAITASEDFDWIASAPIVKKIHRSPRTEKIRPYAVGFAKLE